MDKNLISTLVSIQKKLKAPKGKYNKFGKFNFRSCEDILEAVKPLLTEEEVVLTLTDEIILIGDWHYLKATASITDGKDLIQTTAFAREPITLAGMSDPQVTGSASSYARKYALNGLFCIDDNKDVDSVEDNIGSTSIEDAIKELKRTKNRDELVAVYNKYAIYKTSPSFVEASKEQSLKFGNGTKK